MEITDLVLDAASLQYLEKNYIPSKLKDYIYFVNKVTGIKICLSETGESFVSTKKITKIDFASHQDALDFIRIK